MSQIKPSYDENRLILANVIPLKEPLAIQLTPSSICNFRCNYCIHSQSPGKGINMDWDTFFLVCGYLAEFEKKPKQITMAGWGEPLINPDLPMMISHIKKHNLAERVSIVTNGYLLKEGCVLKLIDSGVDAIKISIQGITSEKYKSITGVRIDYEKLLNWITYLYHHKANCQVYVKIADSALDEGDEERFYSMFGEISDRMYVETICPIFKEGENPVNKFGQPHDPVLVCPHPFYNMNITAEGDILPCCSYYDPTGFGNVKDRSLRGVWESPEMTFFWWVHLAKIRNIQEKYPICRGCKIPDVITLPEDNLDEWPCGGDNYGEVTL